MRRAERLFGTGTAIYPDFALHFDQRRYKWGERDQGFPYTKANEFWHTQSKALWQKIESSPQGTDEFVGRLITLPVSDQQRVISLLNLTSYKEQGEKRRNDLGVIYAGLLEYYFSGYSGDLEDEESFAQKRHAFFESAERSEPLSSLYSTLSTLSGRARMNEEILIGIQKYGKILAGQLNRLRADQLAKVLTVTSEEIREMLELHGLHSLSVSYDPYATRETVERRASTSEIANEFLRMNRQEQLKTLGLILQSLYKRKKDL